MDWPIHIVAAGGIVENEKHEILMVKLEHRGWEYPGGIIEMGENVINGIIREIKEESGIDVEVVKLLGVYSCTDTKKWLDGVTDLPPRLNFDFYCKPIGGSLQTSEETSDVRWVPKEDVLEMINEGSFCRHKYLKFLENDNIINFTECKSGVRPIEVIENFVIRNS